MSTALANAALGTSYFTIQRGYHSSAVCGPFQLSLPIAQYRNVVMEPLKSQRLRPLNDVCGPSPESLLTVRCRNVMLAPGSLRLLNSCYLD